MRQLLNAAVVAIASNAVAAGVTQVVGSTIDTQGYQDVTILASLGDITATGTATLKAAQGDAADGSSVEYPRMPWNGTKGYFSVWSGMISVPAHQEDAL